YPKIEVVVAMSYAVAIDVDGSLPAHAVDRPHRRHHQVQVPVGGERCSVPKERRTSNGCLVHVSPRPENERGPDETVQPRNAPRIALVEVSGVIDLPAADEHQDRRRDEVEPVLSNLRDVGRDVAGPDVTDTC